MIALDTNKSALSVEGGESATAIRERSPAAVASLLFLLLAFATSTVFVQQAWAVQAFQIGVYTLVSTRLLTGIFCGKEHLARGVVPQLIYFIPVWGLVQILARTTASTFQTREEILRWGALAGVFFLSQFVCDSTSVRRQFLNAFLVFATSLAVLCVTQLFTSEGRVLWVFSSGYSDVYATFPNRNNFAQFVELALPIALWRAITVV